MSYIDNLNEWFLIHLKFRYLTVAELNHFFLSICPSMFCSSLHLSECQNWKFKSFNCLIISKVWLATQRFLNRVSVLEKFFRWIVEEITKLGMYKWMYRHQRIDQLMPQCKREMFKELYFYGSEVDKLRWLLLTKWHGVCEEVLNQHKRYCTCPGFLCFFNWIKDLDLRNIS